MGNRKVEKYSITHMMLSECRESCRVSMVHERKLMIKKYF